MILILNILDNNNLFLSIIEQGNFKVTNKFVLSKEQGVLFYLDKFFQKNKLSWPRINGIILLSNQISLTQVKIITAIINTLGWNFSMPVMGKFNFKEKLEDSLPALLSEFKKQKEFTPIKAIYRHKADITVSPRKQKFIIEK